MRSLVTSIFLYACESWTFTAELQRRIQAIEMWFYRKILGISYKDHFTNEEVCTKIQQGIGPHEDLLTIIKKTQTAVIWSCLPFIRSGQNHLARHSEREKTRKRWEDRIREWTGLEFVKSQRAVENREKWRKLVVKLSVVPQQSSRLRDRLDVR